MDKYCVNKHAQSNGDHEVHNLAKGTFCLPDKENQKYLGEFSSCHGAVREAQKTYPKSNGCKHCARECHTT